MDARAPALEELLAHAAWARRLARSLTLDETRAEDAVQDVFVAALERPPRSTANPRGWLARVLTNTARSAGRAESRRAGREHAAARPEALPSSAELASELEWQRRIAAAVLALEEPYRTTLLLSYYRGLAPAEIARRRGEPAATVRSHLKRGLDQLRARFDREHGGDRRAWSVALVSWTREEPEVALASASGLAVATWIALALVSGGGGWIAWNASRAHARATTELAAAASVAPPSESEAALSRSEETAAHAPESSRVPTPTSPATAPAATGPLFIGTVRDPDGAPIEGARLAIYPDKSWPRPEPIGRGVTGPDGRFAFPIGPTNSAYLMIGAEAEGYQGLTTDPVVAEQEISIELTWQVELFGVVRDAVSHAPLAGVTLSGAEKGTTTSDENGRYRLGGFPSGLVRTIRARLAGYATAEREVLARGKEAQNLDLELAPGTPLEVEWDPLESTCRHASLSIL